MSAIASPDEAARPAVDADVPAIVAMVIAAGDEKRGQKGGEVWYRRERRQGDPEADVRAALAAADRHVVVGTLDGLAVGYALAHAERLADGGLLGVVDDLYVEPAARAVGIGEAVMEEVLAWCRAQGCFGVDSLALPGDRPTKNFFESFGLVARAIVVHRPLG